MDSTGTPIMTILAALLPLVLILSVLLQIWVMLAVGMARRRSGIDAPAMSGDPGLERAVRVQANTIEQFAMFLPSLAVAAMFWSPAWATILGLVWIAGRVAYALGYWKAANRRGLGFMVAALATLTLLVGGSISWVSTVLALF